MEWCVMMNRALTALEHLANPEMTYPVFKSSFEKRRHSGRQPRNVRAVRDASIGAGVRGPQRDNALWRNKPTAKTQR